MQLLKGFSIFIISVRNLFLKTTYFRGSCFSQCWAENYQQLPPLLVTKYKVVTIILSNCQQCPVPCFKITQLIGRWTAKQFLQEQASCYVSIACFKITQLIRKWTPKQFLQEQASCYASIAHTEQVCDIVKTHNYFKTTIKAMQSFLNDCALQLSTIKVKYNKNYVILTFLLFGHVRFLFLNTILCISISDFKSSLNNFFFK